MAAQLNKQRTHSQWTRHGGNHLNSEQRETLEESILAACLGSESACRKASERIQTYHFENIPRQGLWRILLAELKAGNGWDLSRISISAREKDDVWQVCQKALSGMASCQDYSDWFTTELITAWADHERRLSLDRLVKKGNVTVESLEGIIKEYGSQTSEYTGGPINGKAALLTAIDVIQDRWEKRQNGEIIGIRTGLDAWDKGSGGIYRANVTTIAAAPGFGKTSVLMKIVETNCMDKKNCLVFSLEMSNEELVTRLLVKLTGIPIFRIMSGELSKSDFNKLALAIPQATDMAKYMWLDDTPGITPEYYTRTVRQVAGERQIDLCAVDYLGITGGDPRLDKRERVAEFMTTTKNEAKRGNFAQVNFSQVTREGRKKEEPSMDSLAESAAVEDTSSVIAFLLRPDQGESNSQGFEDAEIKFAKNRHGPVGKIAARFYPRTMDWTAPVVD
jgi:replicative DNA helicase